MITMNRTLGLPLSAGALALLLSALPSAAQVETVDMDARWVPFIGCWEAVGAEDEIGLLCFSPTGDGVEVTNYVEGEISSIELLVGDGERRSVSAEGCEGWESLVFSEDGRRAFTQTEFLCGDSETRQGTGVMTFLSTTGWADVRALEVDGESFAWVQEYELASMESLREHEIADPAADLGMAVRSARMAASVGIGIDDVIEATTTMDDKAIETWVMLQGDDLRADARDLIALQDAGVSDELIDAVVAVSNPEEFMVEVGQDVDRYDVPPYPVHYRGYMSVAQYWGPRWGSRYGYSPYYSPFYGGGYYGGYGGGYYPGYYGYGYYGSRPGIVVVSPRGNRGGGAVYRDGYRRGGDRAGRTARPRGAEPAATGSGASSRGGSTGSTPRRAKPRRRTSGDATPQASGILSSIGTSPVSPSRAGSGRSGATSRRVTTRPSAATPSRAGRTITRAPAADRTRVQSAMPRPAPRRVARQANSRMSRPSAPSRVSRPSGPSRASTPRASRPSRPSGARPSASRPSAGARPSGARPSRPSGAARRPSGRR